jgi:hypothetical protein
MQESDVRPPVGILEPDEPQNEKGLRDGGLFVAKAGIEPATFGL